MSTIVFDLDGTLIDSYRDIARALNDVLESLDLPTHDPEGVKTMIGGGVSKLLSRALGEATADRYDAARARFKEAYQARLTESTRCYDGILESLAELSRAGFTLVVATNKPRVFTAEIVRRLELDQLGIAAFASADEVAHGKPDPAVVRLALSRAEAPAPLAYVGDMPIDVETGRRAGLEVVGALWGFDPAGLQASRCDVFARQPGELGAVMRAVTKSKDKHQT